MDRDVDKTFYTVTMARLLSQQGRYDQAERIYRHLVGRMPERADLRQALEETAAKLASTSDRWPAVTALIERWVRLTLRYQALRRLRRIALRPGADPLETETKTQWKGHIGPR